MWEKNLKAKCNVADSLRLSLTSSWVGLLLCELLGLLRILFVSKADVCVELENQHESTLTRQNDWNMSIFADIDVVY